MKVRDAITLEMKKLGKMKKTVFLGENVVNSGRIYGTLNDVPISKCIEMPIAENLIAGTAIGLALAGWIPICIFQRMDFTLIAADQIINHAALLPKITGGRVVPFVIFRTIRAELTETFFVGHQHSKDFSHVFSPYLKTYQIPDKDPKKVYEWIFQCRQPALVVEDYARYNHTL